MKDLYSISRGVHRGHFIRRSGDLLLACSDELSRVPGVSHGFSTRAGGVSPAPYDSLNMSLSRDENLKNVRRNYKIFASAFSLDHASLVLVNHEHGANVVRVDRNDHGRGLEREPLPFCDGIVTNDPAVTLVTLHADCGCVYLYDPEHKAIGLAHAGWKGTFLRVGERLAEKMQREFSSRPEALIGALGPVICKNCFEVDEAIGRDFAREFGTESIVKSGKKGKAYVDLESALLIQLLHAGLAPEHLSSMDLCTYERGDLFFSYRRDKGGTGAMIGFLKLN